MANRDVIARNLAAAFLSGSWSARSMRKRGTDALGSTPGWLPALVRRVRRVHPTAPDEQTLTELIADHRAFREDNSVRLARLFWVTPHMQARPDWPVPSIATTGALAEWLGLTPGQLDWFADCRAREARMPDGPLRHYCYLWMASRGGKRRLLESPRPRLKSIQRRFLHEILDHIPAHDSAHGYRPGRSIVSYAAPHAGRQIVLRLDLRDFFPSVNVARVRAVFRAAGYPREVANSLAGLCTNVTPDDIWPADSDFETRARFRSPHLPQGAPTSPALANLVAFRLDRRLTGLANKLGATYTRYADDLAFSGGESLERSPMRFRDSVARIALDEGFELNFRKTRLMPRSTRQSLAGVVVNERPNGRRADYDRLEAILFNCLRFGATSQNRAGVPDFRAHLAGRLAHLARLNPARGRRLRELFDRIEWSV
jgi:RNA-directed DNA polymerase